MSFLDIGVRYLSRPTRPDPKSPTVVADGIRRMVEGGDIDPATRFVKEADHLADLRAYDAALESTALAAYLRGRRDELLLWLLLVVGVGALAVMVGSLLQAAGVLK